MNFVAKIISWFYFVGFYSTIYLGKWALVNSVTYTFFGRKKEWIFINF